VIHESQAWLGGAGDEISSQVMGASVQIKTIAVIGDVDIGAVDGKGFIESSLWVLTVFFFGDGVWCMIMPLSTQVPLRHFRELSGLIDIMLPLPFFSDGDGGHCVIPG